MTKIIRGIIAAILMVVFLTEIVVMVTSLSGFDSFSNNGHALIQCESQPVFTLLAEENQSENFKFKSDCTQSLGPVHIATLYFPANQTGKIISNQNNESVVGPLPFYTLFRSLIL